MIFPWVSRALYDVQVASVAQLMVSGARQAEANANLIGMIERERERFDHLLEKYSALKLAGASAPEAARATFARPEPDVVTQAIITKGKYSIELRKHYLAYAAEQRAMQVDDETIAAAILAGHSDDEEGVTVA